MKLPGQASRGDEAGQWPTKIRQAHLDLTQTPAHTIELMPPTGSSAGLAPKVVMAGSFNPLHHGHCQMAQIAGEVTGHPVHFELSINNADKPPLDATETIRRLQPGITGIAADRILTSGNPASGQQPGSAACKDTVQFKPFGLLLSDLAGFVAKSEQLPNSIFVVGIDTWIRVANPEFYGPDMLEPSMELIAMHGCRFLVFGRLMSDRFTGLDESISDKSISQTLRDISAAVPESRFRFDISSTLLRDQTQP